MNEGIKNQFEELLKDVLTNSTVIDNDKLPLGIEWVLNSHLVKKFQNTEKNVLLLYLLEYIVYICSFSGIRIQGNIIVADDKTAPINMYSILFKGSGGGKDKVNNYFKHTVTKEILAEFKAFKKEAYRFRQQEILKDAEEKHPDNKTAQTIYYEANKPREPKLFSTNGTPQGFFGDRFAFYQTHFGCSFYFVKEIGSFFKTFGKEKEEIIEILNNSFDMGETEQNTTRKDMEEHVIENVPNMLHMHGSPVSFNKPNLNEKIIELFTEGLARRSFFCFSERKDQEIKPNTNPDEIINNIMNLERKSEDDKGTVKKYFQEMFEEVFHPKVQIKKRIALSEEAEKYLYTYRYYQENFIEATLSDMQRVEREGRWWKAFKIAGAIALFENPKATEISLEIIQCSLYLVEVYGNYYRIFENRRPENEIQRAFQFMVERRGWVLSGELKNHIGYRNELIKFKYPQFIADLTEYSAIQNYNFITEPSSKKGEKYKVEKMELNNLDNIKISQAGGLSTGTDFRTKTIKWSEFHKITGTDKSWSCSTFKNNYRKDDNSDGIIQVIGLDIDGGMTLEEAKKFLEEKNLKALVATTRSHQIAKDKKPACDRFRIVLPLRAPFKGTKEEYSKMMQNIYDDFKLPVDVATKNISRLWFGTSNSQHFYTEGETFDHEPYITQKEKKKKAEPKAIQDPVRKSEKSKKSEQSGRRTVRTRGQGITLAELYEQDMKEFLRRIDFKPLAEGEGGGRNNYLHRIGKWVFDEGMNVEEVLTFLNNNFQEPLDDQELHTIIGSIVR